MKKVRREDRPDMFKMTTSLGYVENNFKSLSNFSNINKN